MTTQQLDNTYHAKTYARFPLTLQEGKGSLVVGEDGKEYIDLGSGIAVNTLGYSDPGWVQAVTDQLTKLQHTSNLYYTEPCAKLAEQLCVRTKMRRVFFSNSGAEANECAIKLARKYGEKDGRFKIVTLINSFHGRTLATLSATGQEVFHQSFQPLPEGFLHTPANDLKGLKRLVSEESVAAILVEPVQGEGGVMPLTREFCEGLQELCNQKDILLMVDEVQTGNGRTGTLFAYEQLGMTPDVLTTAKGLGGGLPIGACLMGEKTAELLNPGDHGSTFGGNPVAAAGALYILSQIDEEFLCEVRRKSNYIQGQLFSHPQVEEISGMGLMLGLKTKRPAGEVIDRCRKLGVLVLKAKDKVRLLPPLNIPMELLVEAVEKIKIAVGEEEME